MGKMTLLTQLTSGSGDLRNARDPTYSGGVQEELDHCHHVPGRGRMDDASMALFCNDQARCIHPPFVECYAGPSDFYHI